MLDVEAIGLSSCCVDESVGENDPDEEADTKEKRGAAV